MQAARGGHEDVVDILVGAGANLGGMETEYAELSLRNALESGDQNAVAVWAKTGMRTVVQSPVLKQ